MTSLVDKCLTGEDKFQKFLEVIKECDIQTGYDFTHFMSIVKEHCLDKGITDYKKVLDCWNSHKNSLKEITKKLKQIDTNINENEL